MTDKLQHDGNQAQNAAILLKVAQTMAKLGVARLPAQLRTVLRGLCPATIRR